MKTIFDAVTDIYKLIAVDSVKDQLSGSVYKNTRPYGSQVADVVINGLALTNRVNQIGVVNINIHAPNLILQGDTSQPDTVKMNEVAKTIVSILDPYWAEDFHCDIDTAGNLFEDTDKTYYLNLRVNYYSFVNNFQNL